LERKTNSFPFLPKIIGNNIPPRFPLGNHIKKSFASNQIFLIRNFQEERKIVEKVNTWKLKKLKITLGENNAISFRRIKKKERKLQRFFFLFKK